MPATNRALLLEFQTLSRGFFVTALSAKPINDLSLILARGDKEVFNLCRELAFQADSLKPLEKLKDLGFTPEAISEMYEQCERDLSRMLGRIKALE